MDPIPLEQARDSAFRRRVEQESGQNVAACYQCGNCTAGCPAAFAYEMQAHQIMRAVQLGLKDEVLSSPSLWYCLSCGTCALRCPNNIGVAEVMETLRHTARREGRVRAPAINRFWLSFLEMVRRFGRSYELGVMALYKIRSGRLFGDMDIAIPALSRGKLGMLPHVVKGNGEVGRIFERYKARCEQEGVEP
jgi:heterodisulfide reductase subunit C